MFACQYLLPTPTKYLDSNGQGAVITIRITWQPLRNTHRSNINSISETKRRLAGVPGIWQAIWRIVLQLPVGLPEVRR